jgi:preprotein translocase subunit Sec63
VTHPQNLHRRRHERNTRNIKKRKAKKTRKVNEDIPNITVMTIKIVTESHPHVNTGIALDQEIVMSEGNRKASQLLEEVGVLNDLTQGM